MRNSKTAMARITLSEGAGTFRVSDHLRVSPDVADERPRLQVACNEEQEKMREQKSCVGDYYTCGAFYNLESVLFVSCLQKGTSTNRSSLSIVLMPVPLKGTNIYRALLQALKGGFMLYVFTFKSNNSVIWALRLSLELHKETQRS